MRRPLCSLLPSGCGEKPVPYLKSSPAWFVVAVTTAAQMVVAMSNIVLPTIAPKVAESLAVDPVLVGYHVGLTFGSAAVASLYSGISVRRWGAALTTQLSMLFCVIGLALFALPHVAYIALGSILVGAGMGFASPAAAHLLVHRTAAERRNLMFSIKQTGVPLGGVIVSLVAPALAVTVGWQWALATIAAVAIATLLATELARREWDSDRQPAGEVRTEPFGGVPLVWRLEALRWVCLAAVLFSGIQRILLSFTVIYLVAEAGYGLVEAGIMLSMAQIGGSVTRIPWGWLADRLKSGLAVLTILCALMIVSSIALVLLDPSWPKPLVYLLFFVLGAGCLGWNGIVHAECARLSPPGAISLVAGGTSFFIFGGVMFGPPIFALAYGAIGTYGGSFSLMVVAGVASLGLLYLAHRRDAGK
jgi:MFS family permease